MALDTYSELKTAVSDWLQRSDMTAQVPTFIEFATDRFNRELRIDAMVKVADTTLDGEYNALPTGFLAMRSLSSGSRGPLVRVTPDRLESMVSAKATPDRTYYAIVGQQIRVYPVPVALAVTMSYYEALSEMTGNSDTNWLLTRHPDAYLYGSLVEAASFLLDSERMAFWEARYQQAVDGIKRQQRESMAGATPLIVRAA